MANFLKIYFLAILAALLLVFSLSSVRSHAQEGWKSDFDDVCAGTQDAMTLNTDQLQKLISRCDSLKPQIEKLSDPQRKVTLRRLQMCRDLYDFVLQSKEKQ